jgi:hypothetical protein
LGASAATPNSMMGDGCGIGTDVQLLPFQRDAYRGAAEWAGAPPSDRPRIGGAGRVDRFQMVLRVRVGLGSTCQPVPVGAGGMTDAAARQAEEAGCRCARVHCDPDGTAWSTSTRVLADDLTDDLACAGHRKVAESLR